MWQSILNRKLHLKIKPHILNSTRRLVKRMLREDWSPKQVSAIEIVDFNLSLSTNGLTR